VGKVVWPPAPVEPSPDERDLMVAANRMNVLAARSMPQVLPGCEFEAFDGFYVRSHPLPTETLNEAVITRRPRDPDGAVEEALDYFHGRSPRWRLVCAAEWLPLLVAPCERAGLTALPGVPEMILNSERAHIATEGADCRRVDDTGALETFQKTFSSANQVPETGFWRSQALLDAPEWDLFLCFNEGQPVATGLGFTADEMTGVWAIATLPEHRGHGYGTAITWAVVNAGRKKGARATHLRATEMGFPVYRNMGFRHVQNKAVWVYERPQSA
jgi:N-acetylglutamate synthase